MFSKRFHRIVFAFTMSILMTIIMTAVITTVNTGIDAYFAQRWWNALLVAWPIAFLAILMIGKPIQQLTAKICSK
ncbi:MAG: DUF2798 domain-containing protein [Hydrogenovibrio sp.]